METERAADISPLVALGVENVSDLVALFDGDLQLRWMNAAGCRMLGYELDEIVGLSALDYLHPDDVERLTLTIVRLFDPAVDIPVRPAPARLRSASGAFLPFDASGGAFVDEVFGSGVMVIGRPNPDADLHDQLMDLLTNEAPSEEAFAVVPVFGQWRQPLLWHAVFYLDDDGQPAATGDAELVALGGLEAADAPWRLVAEHDGKWFAAADELPPPCRERAIDGGLTNLSAVRVWDAFHEAHAVAAYVQHRGSPSPTNGQVLTTSQYVLDSTARVLALVLGWRNQVLRLRRAASTDPLTGLANRAGFDADWSRRVGATDAGAITVLSVDLDRFKAVNDVHGHQVGDELLVEVATRLRHVVRPEDLVARLGGDEFVVVSAALSEAECERVAERIVTSLGQPFQVREHQLEIGASVGIASAERPTTPKEVLERADQALYDAKAAGRSRWRRRGDAER